MKYFGQLTRVLICMRAIIMVSGQLTQFHFAQLGRTVIIPLAPYHPMDEEHNKTIFKFKNRNINRYLNSIMDIQRAHPSNNPITITLNYPTQPTIITHTSNYSSQLQHFSSKSPPPPPLPLPPTRRLLKSLCGKKIGAVTNR